MKHVVGSLALVLALCGPVRAQVDAPLALQGFVRHELGFGCGQAWSMHVARAQVSLDVDASHHAHFHVDATITDAHGGVSRQPEIGVYHGEDERSLVIEWTGRARLVHGVLRISLRAIRETTSVPGSTSVVTSRTIEEAEIACSPEEHDVMPASRSLSPDPETPVARRTLWSCAFVPRPSEAGAPRPVANVLSGTFFLDVGAGVTTDASDRAGVDALVVREAGWVEP